LRIVLDHSSYSEKNYEKYYLFLLRHVLSPYIHILNPFAFSQFCLNKRSSWVPSSQTTVASLAITKRKLMTAAVAPLQQCRSGVTPRQHLRDGTQRA
jgi:hypothetical protein